MKIKIIVVGRTKELYLLTGEQEYLKRLKRYVDIEWIIIKPIKINIKCDEEKIKIREEKLIKEKIKPGEWVVALDSLAKQKTSEKFADYFQQKMSMGLKYITFIIGGPLGLSKNILQLAQEKISLSKMTFTHEMVRLILLEQIYRAFTIIKREKYHK